MTQTVGSTEGPALSSTSFSMHPSFCISSLQEWWCKQHKMGLLKKNLFAVLQNKKNHLLWKFLFSVHTIKPWKGLGVMRDLFPSPKSCTAAVHMGGDMVQWMVAPGSRSSPCCQAGDLQSLLWLCFLTKLFRNSNSAALCVSGAELGLDGDFYFQMDCLEGFGEADCKDDLCLYFTSIFGVLDFVFSFNSSQGVHTNKMGGSQGGRLKLFSPQGILEVTRISKKSFRSTAYPPYIANLPFAESCLGVDFPLD